MTLCILSNVPFFECIYCTKLETYVGMEIKHCSVISKCAMAFQQPATLPVEHINASARLFLAASAASLVYVQCVQRIKR